MSFSSDASEIEASGNVVRFPGSTDTGRNGWRMIWQQGWQKSLSGLKRHGFTAAAIALAAGGIAAGLWGFSAAGAPRYTTVPATRGTIARAVTATGTINPAQTIVVGANISGTVQNLSCGYNTEVKAGQVCAKIDPRPYQAVLDQYSGQLQRDQAILEKDRADLARLRKHAVGNPFVRQQAQDQAFVVSRDEGTVKLDQALVDEAKLNLGYTDIVAPADGTVVERNVSQGQPVAANSPTLFLIAADPKHMEVDTTASQNDIGAIREGNKATMTVDVQSNRVFEGVVSQVRRSPQSVQNAVTYDAVVNIDNSDLTLKPGMTASAQIVVEQKSDVLRVPDQALRFGPTGAKTQAAGTPANGQSRIWVLRSGAPVAVNVVTGLDDGNFTEIAQGELNPGDQVITGDNRPATPSSGAQTGAP
jgi:HlyD family secretion protein